MRLLTRLALWKRVGMPLVNVLMVTLGLLTACSQQVPKPTPPVPTVRVQILQAQSFQPTLVLPGRVVAVRMAEVRPQVTGIIQAQTFREGSWVKAGTVLYRIEDAPYKAEVQSAQAALQKTQANVGSAQTKLQRMETLLTQQAVSQQERDDAHTAWQQAKADVALAKAKLHSVQINLNNTRITAPISGRIGRSALNQGALVQVGQTQALATIAQLHPVHVDLNLPSSQTTASTALALLKGLGPVTLQLPGPEGKSQAYSHPGQVQFAETQVDPNTGNQTLRAVFPNPEGSLLPGLFVETELRLKPQENAILVPQNTIVRDTTGQASVWVVSTAADNNANTNPQAQVSLRPIRLGAMVGALWHVENGLKAGEQLVVEGAQKLKPGQTVKIKNTPASTTPLPTSTKG